MELEQVQDLLEGIPQAERKSITSLIDIKTDENMKEVITEIRSLRSDFATKFAAIDTKFAAIDSKFDAKFDGLSMRIKTLYWVIGGVATVGVALYAALIGVLWK